MSGALYALLAVGLIIAWQTTRVVNLAHGESYAVGGLAAAGLAQAGLPAWASLPGAVVAAMVFGWATERFLLRPRKDWPSASLILVTLATAFLSRGVLYLAAGVDPLSFPRLLAGRPIRMLGAAWPRQGLALIAVGLVASVAVTLFLQATEAGRRLRATAENPDAAQLLGIDTDQTRATAFIIAGGLGGLGAVLLVPLVSVDYQAGLGMTLRGFIAAALAGMSAPRAVVAGLALGLAESLVTWRFGALAQDPIVFLALIFVALWQSRHIRFGGSARA
jgi:branched-subunit amino acid ABC-type transport system permease component